MHKHNLPTSPSTTARSHFPPHSSPSRFPQHSPYAPQPPTSFGLVCCYRPSKSKCFPWHGLVVPSWCTYSTQNKCYLTALNILERYSGVLRREYIETNGIVCLCLFFLDGPCSLCIKCEIQPGKLFKTGRVLLSHAPCIMELSSLSS